MTDFFALLDEPRRPWLDPEALKEKFLSLSASVHPDRVHSLGAEERAAAQDRYTDLNAAYTCLRETRERLRHLLQLERGAQSTEVRSVPSDLMDFSVEVAAACRRADALLAEKARTSSPLLKVRLFEQAQDRIQQLQELWQKAAMHRDLLTEEVQRIDAAWQPEGNPDAPDRALALGRLAEICQLLGYFERWLDQLRERIAQLSF